MAINTDKIGSQSEKNCYMQLTLIFPMPKILHPLFTDRGPEVIKLFMINSAEHEIRPANKSG